MYLKVPIVNHTFEFLQTMPLGVQEMSYSDPGYTDPATRPYIIYILIDEDEKPRYVGCTSDLTGWKRLNGHRASKSKPWIFDITIVEEVIGCKKAKEAERRWIHKLVDEGANLVNRQLLPRTDPPPCVQ